MAVPPPGSRSPTPACWSKYRITTVVELRELFNNALMHLHTIPIFWKFYLFFPQVIQCQGHSLAWGWQLAWRRGCKANKGSCPRLSSVVRQIRTIGSRWPSSIIWSTARVSYWRLIAKQTGMFRPGCWYSRGSRVWLKRGWVSEWILRLPSDWRVALYQLISPSISQPRPDHNAGNLRAVVPNHQVRSGKGGTRSKNRSLRYFVQR